MLILQLYSGYVIYYKLNLKYYYYYFRVCSNKYYCLLKKKNKDVYPILVVCVQCLLFITSVYNYKNQAILQLYSDYVMYYKPNLKHYYYFCVCSNKYYCLLKKKNDVYPILVVCVQCPLYIISIYNYKCQALLQLYSDYVMYYKSGFKHYYYYYYYFCSNKYYCLLKKKQECLSHIGCMCLVFITPVYNYKC